MSELVPLKFAVAVPSEPSPDSNVRKWPDAWALEEVGSYPAYTGREANVVGTAALDPKRKATLLRGYLPTR